MAFEVLLNYSKRERQSSETKSRMPNVKERQLRRPAIADIWDADGSRGVLFSQLHANARARSRFAHKMFTKAIKRALDRGILTQIGSGDAKRLKVDHTTNPGARLVQSVAETTTKRSLLTCLPV